MVDIVGVATLDADVNRLMRKGSVARSMVPPRIFPTPEGWPTALAQSFDGGEMTFISSSTRPPAAIAKGSASGTAATALTMVSQSPLARRCRSFVHGAGWRLADQLHKQGLSRMRHR